MRVLANDGIDAAGKQILEAAGFEVITDKVTQEELPNEVIYIEFELNSNLLLEISMSFPKFGMPPGAPKHNARCLFL